jgi:hypothetical protein
MSTDRREQAATTRWWGGAAQACTGATTSDDPGAYRARKSFDVMIGTAVFLSVLLLFLLKAPSLEFFMSSRDHGYQLSIGTQVLKGKVPGIDVIIAYGPLVMYTSALGLWITHSLIGETILCSTGYALTVFLIYHLVSRYASRRLGLTAAVFGLLLQARFYKWYVWLIPMAILWSWHRYLNSPVATRWRWVIGGGFILGISWLYRPDFGTTNLAACLVLLGLIEASERPRVAARVFKSAGLFLAAFAVLPIGWLVYLAARVGPLAPLVYLDTTIQATRSVVSGLSHSAPPIRSVIVAYWLIPASYLFALMMFVRQAWTGRLDRRSWFLLASALVGLACLHQAMHRMDPSHLIQVIPTAIVCVSLLASEFLIGAPGLNLSRWVTPWARVAGVGYAILLVAVGLKLLRWGQADLEVFSPWPRERYTGLAHPLGRTNRDPRAAALSAVMKLTGPADPILVFPLDPQFYAFTKRRISGRLHAYYGGVFDSPAACAGNLDAIQAEMPKLVIVPADFEAGTETDDLLVRDSRHSHQYLERFIRQHYPRVLLNDGGIMVLSEGVKPRLSR